jgi:hypothetical protein
VDLLGLVRPVEHGLRAVALALRLLDHRRVHLRVLVGLARDRLLEVLERGADTAGVREVPERVDRLRLGGGAEELRDLREVLLLRLAREGEVLAVRLALAGERDLEVLVGGHGGSGCWRGAPA